MLSYGQKQGVVGSAGCALTVRAARHVLSTCRVRV